jgi:hypothetical protein
MDARSGRGRALRRLLGFVGGCAFASSLVAACGPRSAAGGACDTAGEELCEGTQRLRCDGTRYAVLAACSFQCVDAADVRHEQGTLTSDETWACADGPHVVNGNVTVGVGVTLTIEAGVQLRLTPSSTLDVDPEGRLVVDASAGAPVLVTSDTGAQAGFASPGAGGINLFAVPDGAEPSVLRHVIVERGRNGLGVFGLSTTSTPPVIENCTLRDNQGLGIVVGCDEPDAPVPDFAAAGNQFFDNGGGDVGTCQAR